MVQIYMMEEIFKAYSSLVAQLEAGGNIEDITDRLLCDLNRKYNPDNDSSFNGEVIRTWHFVNVTLYKSHMVSRATFDIILDGLSVE